MSFFWVARRMSMSFTFYKFDFQQNSVTTAKRNMLLKMPS